MTLFFILSFGLLFAFATVLGVAFRKLRLPAILSFFLAGFLVKQLLVPLGFAENFPALSAFSKFGVIFLLFLVGLKLHPGEIWQLGKKIVALGVLQIVLTAGAVALLLALFFPLSLSQTVILAIALSFSSTIVATKLIYARGEQDTLYGKIAFSVLIIQDFAAVALLLLAGAFLSGEVLPARLFLLQVAIKFTVALLLILLSLKLLPRLEKALLKSQELLFLFSLSVCLLFAGVFEALRIGYELGALLAGLLLARSFYQREIASRINPVKNLFVALYFGYLGMLLEPAFLFRYGHLILAVAVLLTWLIKPFIANFLLALFGFSKRDGFKVSLVLAQISEFTIIVALATGFSEQTVSFLVALFIATVVASAALFEHSLSLSRRIRVKWWEKQAGGEVRLYREPRPEIILFGAHRLGYGLIRDLKKLSANILVIDNNPEIVNRLQDEGIACLFGSADEADFLETLDLSRLQMAVSTIPHLDANLFLLQFLRRKRRGKLRVFLATSRSEAERLSRAGADYVIMPYELGRETVGKLFKERGLNKDKWRS